MWTLVTYHLLGRVQDCLDWQDQKGRVEGAFLLYGTQSYRVKQENQTREWLHFSLHSSRL